MKKAELETALAKAQDQIYLLKSLITGRDVMNDKRYLGKKCGQCAYYQEVEGYPKGRPGLCIKHQNLATMRIPLSMHACVEWAPQ